MVESLKQRVYEANKQLPQYELNNSGHKEHK